MDINEFQKKGHNSGTIWQGITKMPCTSTPHRKDAYQVLFRLHKNYGRSLRRNILPTDQPPNLPSADSNLPPPPPYFIS